jgi:hypothetical protein
MSQKSAHGMENGVPEEKHLTVPEQTILIVESLEREVNNGGFDLFFENCEEYSDSAESALRRIGCLKTAVLAANALALHREHSDPESLERSEGLSKLDNQFFDSDENIAEQLFGYIKDHRSEITTMD